MYFDSGRRESVLEFVLFMYMWANCARALALYLAQCCEQRRIGILQTGH